MNHRHNTEDFHWRKSSYSGSQGGECVEVAEGTCHMHLRDSKNPELGYFTFGAQEWGAFLTSTDWN